MSKRDMILVVSDLYLILQNLCRILILTIYQYSP